MLGNNKKAVKFKRIFVPFQRDNDLNSPITGRYYLPDTPDLEKKDIVGIQIHFGGDDISIPNRTILGGVPSGNIGTWSGFVQASFFTLYADTNEEKLLNFPVYGLYNASPRFSRIIPINGKVKIAQSYISTPAVAAPVTTAVLGFSITFFHL
jgi:hypothetical protein